MLVGVTGTLGAGKGTVVDYLVQEKGFTHIAVSDTFLRGEALRRNLTPDRITRRNIANEYRAKSPTALMEAVYALAREKLEAGKDIVLEPQHTAAEVQFIQSMGGVEISVDADLQVRYDRITKRGGEKDNVSFEAFKAAQDFEMRQTDPNMNNLGAAIAAADHHLTNDGTVEELKTHIDEVLEKMA